MKPDDQQLDNLLRDVTVPDGLAARLKQIPHLGSVDVGSTADRWRNAWRFAGLAIAASLIGVLAWLAWPTGERPDPEADGEKTIMLPEETDLPPVNLADASDVPDIDDLSEQIEALTWQIEMHQQRTRLAELRRSASRQSLDPNESRALVAFISQQSALDWGADRETVRSDMLQIIELYPQTTGAARARQFLASTDPDSPAIQ